MGTGGVNEGGRGATIWDIFCHTEGKIQGGHTGDVACDHYHLYRDDIALLKVIFFLYSFWGING